MAELQSRTRAFDFAIENIYNEFRRRAARLLGLENQSTTRKDLAILLSERLNRDEMEIYNLMRKCEDIMHGEPTNKKTVVKLAGDLREIEEYARTPADGKENIMPISAWILLILLFALTSVIGVVTGSNSLIAVPVMFQFGIDPKTAVATNMFGLTFMKIGATIPFLGKGIIDQKKVAPLVGITLISSAIGALLVGLSRARALKLIVSAAMIVVALFTLLKRNAGIAGIAEISTRAVVLTYILTFILGIYGGLYSGGYTIADGAVCRAFRNDVYRSGRVDEIDQCVFVPDCDNDFRVAKFD